MTVHAITVGPGTLIFGDPGNITSLSSQITSCSVVPDIKTDDPTLVLTMEKIPGDRTETFTLKGKLKQDFGYKDSIAEWTYSRRGETIDFEYIPTTVTERGIRGTAVVEPIEIGGDVGSKPDADFEWEMMSPPEFFDIADAELINS